MNKEKELQVFQYEGNDVAFDVGNGHQMVNATQMAKKFGKKPIEFLRLPSTKAFVESLEKTEVGKSHFATKGGDLSKNEQGTWMHELLALKFAGWLSPDFEIWMMARVRELLINGSVEMLDYPKEGKVLKLPNGKRLRTIDEMKETYFVRSKRSVIFQPNEGLIWKDAIINDLPNPIQVVEFQDGTLWVNFVKFLKERGSYKGHVDLWAFLEDVADDDWCYIQVDKRGWKSVFVREPALKQWYYERIELHLPQKEAIAVAVAVDCGGRKRLKEWLDCIVKVESKEVRLVLFGLWCKDYDKLNKKGGTPC